MAASTLYGRLLIVGKEGCADLEFPIDKNSVLIGRQALPLLSCRGLPSSLVGAWPHACVVPAEEASYA